jgi:uroporphyrinogen-III synthase
VLHFSPRSAEIFVTLARKERLESAFTALRHLCLSDATAAALPPGARTEVAPRPEEEALLALLDV